MNARVVLAVFFALAAASLFADSIDDADAKRRGVPVAQVIAENALAKEKLKTAALEKQVAELQKKLAEATGQPAPGAAMTAPGSSSGGVSATAPKTPTTPGTPTAPAAAINFDGPREASPLYDDLVNRYLSGDWTTLGADLAAKQKEIAALPAGNAADLAYIKQTVAECRPAWWDQIKTGKSKQFQQKIWRQPITINFQDGPAARFVGANGGAFSLSWPMAHMDLREPMPMTDISLSIPGDHGFVRADGIDNVLWNMMGGVAIQTQVGAVKIASMTAGEKAQYIRYAGFWQNVTAGYYGTPPARLLVLIQSCASFETAMNDEVPWTSRRPLGAALMMEITEHHERYKTLHVEPILGLDKAAIEGVAEEFLAKPVMMQLLGVKFTLEEDRHIRDMVKTLADANTNWNAPKLTLQNNLHINLDPANDVANMSERVNYILGGGSRSPSATAPKGSNSPATRPLP